ncbi:glycosyltransferase family 4 protein [Streptomyces sp. XM4193]|uniref:glycosyltransferase family 4 protein n=1 Tax=Streptomyces sp. XM4193 TaxID=2929782 RepID=UPI001FFB2269|nr:glycosyltransferase family 4 protein [Streptomyces sp. XM4193]
MATVEDREPGARRRPSVLHLSQPVEGGVATVVTDLVAAQRQAGLEVHLGCPPGPLGESARSAGARVHHWPAGRGPGPGLFTEICRITGLLDRLRPDLLHLHSAEAGLAGRLAARGRVPTVFQPHAWSFEAVTGTSRALALKWERRAARWAARLLCVSEAERRRGENAGVRGDWAVVPNGIDLGRYPLDFTTAADSRTAARAALPECAALPDGAPVVVCVGRLSEQKGQDVLLRSWPTVTARHPRALLVLVGDGPAAGALRSAAPAGVVFAGAVRTVRTWYQAADLVVLPSRWEGMALAPLEAMACGRPVLLTDVAGARECLPNGHAARQLVPADDPFALGRALGALLAEPGRLVAAGIEARAHVTTNHDVRRSAAEVGDLYRELLRRPHQDRRERLLR